MYRILIADDESIVRESLKFIIESRHGDSCEIQCAKTGKSVIEIAENFRPDIAFMDIHMPGINGIDAMKEIRKNNDSVIFIVMTAFDKFDYAKEAIAIGVLEYLSKPVSKNRIEETLSKAMSIIDKRREVRSRDLTIKEKLETVIPYIERGLVYTVLVNEDSSEAIEKYKELLGIDSKYAYVLIVEARQEYTKNNTNLVGSGIRLEDHYEFIKESIKDECYALVGPVMTNKIIVIIPYRDKVMELEERTLLVDSTRRLIHRLEDEINAEIKVGIGKVKRFNQLKDSYHEATSALSIGIGSVIHAQDLNIGCSYEDDYPIDIEDKMFEAIEKGEIDNTEAQANFFFSWMETRQLENLQDIKIKIIDFVLWAEHIAYNKANLLYKFNARTNYLKFIYECDDVQLLKNWFVEKMVKSAEKVSKVIEESQKTPVEKAINYINEKYDEDISLDQMSQILGISTYYFSKLFKNETSRNFIDYLTDIRITKAKELLSKGEIPVKDVGCMVGYPDANYFSRIFKKNVGLSPTEFKA